MGVCGPHPAAMKYMTQPENARSGAGASQAPGGDQVRRFLIENQPVRGHWVHLGPAWRDLRAHQEYPAPIRDLLGEAVVSSVLLAATLKFCGTLTLQFEGNGLLRLLIAQCTHDFGVRAVARFDAQALQGSIGKPAGGWTFRSLVGDAGRVIVTIEAGERDLRYQGVVPLAGESLPDSLEAYFTSSEQLPTRVRLAAGEREAAGLLIQKLPETQDVDEGQDEADSVSSVWQRAQLGVAALGPQELLDGSIEAVLAASLGREDLRLFKAAPVRSECRCSPERVSELLRAIGQAEVSDVIREQGSVTVTCEFCQRPYRFTASDAEVLFGSDTVPPGSGALH